MSLSVCQSVSLPSALFAVCVSVCRLSVSGPSGLGLAGWQAGWPAGWQAGWPSWQLATLLWLLCWAYILDSCFSQCALAKIDVRRSWQKVDEAQAQAAPVSAEPPKTGKARGQAH